MQNISIETVSFPLSVFQTAESKEDLEDWLLTQNPSFIKKIRSLKKEDVLEEGSNWKQLKDELCLK